MRPLKLEIGGLQSFEAKQVIDFEYLSEYGIFGIFGPTGSGKSTILDAITLSLYGEIVRIKNASKQDTIDDLMNINSKEIYVKFIFGIAKDTYTIEKTFKSKKKERKIYRKKVLMLKNSDVIADKVSEINKEIKGIIGLNMDDFTRSVILPQGQFSDFLKLTGTERRSMLERLFNLEAYGRSLINKVKERKTYYLKEISAIDNQMKGKGEISLDLIRSNNENINKINMELLDLDNFINELLVLIKDAEEVLSLENELLEYKNKFEIIDLEKDEIQKLEESLEKNEKARSINYKYEILQKDQEFFLEKKHLKDKLLPQILNSQKEIEGLSKKIRELQENKKELIHKINENKISKEELENISKIKLSLHSLIKLDESSVSLKKEIISLEEKLELLNLKIENLNINSKNLEEEISKIIQVEDKEIFELEKQIYNLNIKEILEIEENINKLSKNIEKNKVEKDKLGKKIQELELEQKKYKENILSDLAKNLKEGEACMLCGSLEHPNIFNGHTYKEPLEDFSSNLIDLKAKCSSIKLGKLELELSSYYKKLDNRNYKESLFLEKSIKENIKELKLKQEKNLKLYREKNYNLEKVIKNLEVLSREKLSLEENIKNKVENLKNIDFELKKYKEEFIKINSKYIIQDKIMYTNIENIISDFERRYVYFESLEKKLKLIEDEIYHLESQKEKLFSKNEDIQKEFESVKGELIHLERIYIRSLEEYEKLITDLPYENIQDIKGDILKDEFIVEISNRVEEYSNNRTKTLNYISNVEDKLKGRQVNIEIYEENKNKLNKFIEEKKDKTKGLNILQLKKENFEKLGLELENLLMEKEKYNKEYVKYEDLSKLFEGNKFIEFIALGKIRDIAKSASSRLSKMSNGRYALTSDKQGNFLIVDNFNGGEMRKSATLSGGESFLVSLSLALSLSNQIQLKGKEALEFFFLDEGFGTLDVNLLDKVISSLENIREQEGVKIGLISHVEELKERIPRKIELIRAIGGQQGSLIKLL